MNSSKQAIDDFLNFKNQDNKKGNAEFPIKTCIKGELEKATQKNQKQKQHLLKNLRKMPKDGYEPQINILKTQVQNQVSLIIHRSYLALVNGKTEDPVPLTSIFEIVNNNMILGNFDIFKNIIESKKHIFKTQDDYKHISLTGSHYSVFCEYLKICPNITVIKQPEIERKMKTNSIQTKTKFETKTEKGNVSFVKVIATMNLTSDNMWTALIKSRNKVYCLGVKNDVIEKENQFSDAEKVSISVRFYENHEILRCNVFCVKPLNAEEKVGIKTCTEMINSIERKSPSLPFSKRDEHFVVHNIIAKLNSAQNSQLTIKQLHFFMSKSVKFIVEQEKLLDIVKRYENIFTIEDENSITSKKFDGKYFEDYLQMGQSCKVLKQSNKLPELSVSKQLQISSKKGTVSISNLRGKLVKCDPLTFAVLFKVSENSKDVFSIHCKPGAFGNQLPNMDLDVIFKMSVNAGGKKKNVTFSIVGGKVHVEQEITKSIENEATVNRINEINQAQDDDDETLDKATKTCNELIIYSTIMRLLLKPKKNKPQSIDSLYNEQQQWFKDLISQSIYNSVVKNSEIFLQVTNTIVLQSEWIKNFLYIGCNVTKFTENLDNLDPIPISDNPMWKILGTTKFKEIVIKNVFAKVICQSETLKRVLVRFGESYDIIAIDCSMTEVEEGPKQPISIVINESSVRKNKTVRFFVTRGKDLENKSNNKLKNNRSKKQMSKKKILEYDEEMDNECLDDISYSVLSSVNPIVLTLSDSEDETETDEIAATPKLEIDSKQLVEPMETSEIGHNIMRKNSCCIN